MESSPLADCIVVGAGIAGLLAARTLRDSGKTVVVLDKARGVGGRMATRRIGASVFDHGAQFFTATDPRFVAHVNHWVESEIAAVWAKGFAGPKGPAVSDGYPRYRGAQGMTSIPKYVADCMDIRLNNAVTAARPENTLWTLVTADGEEVRGRALVLTPPVPQSLAILGAGSVVLPEDVRQSLTMVDYDPCFSVMAVLDGPSHVPAPGGIRLPNDAIMWIADNRAKGICPNGFGVTIHATPHFSRDYLDKDPAVVGSVLLGMAHDWLAANVLDSQVHFWRYAQPVRTYPRPCLYVSEPAPLVFAGDAFGGPRIEGAALSGLAAADRLLNVAKI